MKAMRVDYEGVLRDIPAIEEEALASVDALMEAWRLLVNDKARSDELFTE